MIEKQITVVIDDANTKHTATKSVFSSYFKNPSLVSVESDNIPAPFSSDELIPRTIIRLDRLKRTFSQERSTEVFFVTFQRGFYKEGERWYLTVIAIVECPDGTMIPNRGVSIPLDESISQAMNVDTKWRFNAIKNIFPLWHDKIPMFNVFTGEEEIEWYKQTLRYIVKLIAREKYS